VAASPPIQEICPTCFRPLRWPDQRARRRQLVREIQTLQRQILALQNGDLDDIIANQASAPGCTICSQAPPGKPGQPTDTAARVRPLQRRLDLLQRQFIALGSKTRGRLPDQVGG
jgi:hypothetical protein